MEEAPGEQASKRTWRWLLVVTLKQVEANMQVAPGRSVGAASEKNWRRLLERELKLLLKRNGGGSLGELKWLPKWIAGRSLR